MKKATAYNLVVLVTIGALILINESASSNKPPTQKAATTKRAQEYFVQHKNNYGNKADAAALQRLFGYVSQLGLDKPSSHVFVGGTNDASDVVQILKTCPNVSFYGFEIQASFFKTAQLNTKQYANAKMFNLGWGERSSTSRIGGEGEAAGLFDPKGQFGFKLTAATIQTVPLGQWTKEQSIDRVLYVLIDTEGFEPKVIRGMQLDRKENQRKFPLFQYELGGTWGERDNRHGADAWTQQVTAEKLQSWGYSLFLIGATDWLRVTPDFFDPNTRPQDKDLTQPHVFDNAGYGMFVQGNLLAMHDAFVQTDLKEKILQASRQE